MLTNNLDKNQLQETFATKSIRYDAIVIGEDQNISLYIQPEF